MKKNLLFGFLALLSTALQAQVTQILANKGLDASSSIPFNNNKVMLTSDIDSTVWVSDGTIAGTLQLSSTITFDGSASGLLNGKVIFAGNTPATGQELFISDGTAGGTFLLKDINPGTDSSNADNFTLLNSILYFTAETVAEGRELWRTDGTSNGTVLVKDIVPGPTGSNTTDNYNFFSNGSYLLFSAQTTGLGMELWKSDGTNAGTVLLKDINPGAASSDAGNFTSYNNIVLFTATDSVYGNEIWKTDGTAAGTSLLKDINPGVGSSSSSLGILNLSVFKGRLYFAADDGAHGAELWSTDGTTQNTNMVKDIQPDSTGSMSYFIPVPIGDKFLFNATTTAYGSELWESDGTEAGTKLFKDFNPGPKGSHAFVLFPLVLNINTQKISYGLFQGNKVFITASDSVHGSELWVSDGTPDGTFMTKDIYPGNGSSFAESYMYTSSAFYFAANDSTHGSELWKSDGTSAGTVFVKDINPNIEDGVPAGSDISFIPYIINSKVIFEATDGDGEANDLYVVDGSFSPLPLKLGDFTVTPKNADALLQWTTLSEENTRDFTVQRSDDGSSFTNIGTVAAAGTSSVTQNYYFTDAGIMNSGKDVVYYRLVATDKDGKTATSKIISLKINAGQWDVKLVTNLVRADLDVMLTGTEGIVKMSIKDISGKTVSNSTTASNGHITLRSSQLMPGMYFLVAEKNSERRVIKFIKQ